MWHGQFNYSVCLKKSAVIILPIIIQECCIQFLFLFSLPATEWISDFLTICKKKKCQRYYLYTCFLAVCTCGSCWHAVVLLKRYMFTCIILCMIWFGLNQLDYTCILYMVYNTVTGFCYGWKSGYYMP